jgi:hypothetical protein
MRVPFILLIILLLQASTKAQIILKGKLMDSKSDLPLAGVTIYNSSQKIYKKSGYDGQYSIFSYDRDTLIFSFVGYRSDTVEVFADRIQDGLDVGLKALPPKLLDTFTVRSRSYILDSLQRRQDYAAFYKQPLHNATGGNTPSSGFGISLSPISYFSKQERSKRAFKKRLQNNEEQAYIDFHFSPSYVYRLTGLTGDTLQQFVRKYRPSYDFLRSKTSEDLVWYVNESLKAYKKTQPGKKADTTVVSPSGDVRKQQNK